ncbi:ABC transporter substrate-binding protein/permease [Fimbriimonas ginsengisoli]|uniref:Glutamine-binding periplasmic protein of glutamine ABC transporter n=1 Tax=Fimbriimonas ginsengisoli Gsoil 348 TaxID=661478 RepID=A0A068NRG5_FIMGI|nr:ABC transporter substrate-binding protein/permease [Fimbriimonas ginsengisoli]AIE85360.1 glutamine-binding periplasmic protein of glutamine ABC transporter [Fimbriimonas ginsengisoli Gsoil 348]
MQVRAWIRFLLLVVGMTASGVLHAQGIIDTIRSRGELVIATDATYPPFEYKKDGQIIGFDVDVATELARDLGVKLRWIDSEWAGVLGALESGKADLVMAGVTITEERKTKGYLFSRPYFLSGQVIARRKGDTRIQKPEDLKDKIVSVQQETTGQFAVQKIGVPKDHMLKFDQIQDGLLDLRNKKSDACVGDLPTIKAILSKGYPEIELAGPVFVKENLGIVAWKTHPELIAQVNRSLDRMMAGGAYARSYPQWFEEPYDTALVAALDKVKDQGSPVPAALEAATAHPIGTVQSVGGSAFTFRWDLLKDALPILARGAVLTLELTALSLVFGVVGGLLLALARVSPFVLFRPFAVAYVEVVRGTPLLMQIYVIYFVLPAIGIGLSPFVAGVLALSLNAAAYTSEIFRAGIESIDSGQMEAARSLGMDYPTAMRWVILPQTLRRVLPPLTNEAVALLKDSSLVSVVALSELMRAGKEIATNSGSPTTVYLTVAVFYLVMTLPLTWLVRRLEQKWQPISRPRAKKVAV